MPRTVTEKKAADRSPKAARLFAFIPADRRRARCSRMRTAEEVRLDDDLQGLFDAVRDEEGCAPTPDFQRVARGDGFPWRILARYIVRAARKGADEQRVLAIVDRLRDFVREVFRAYGSRRRVA